MKTTLIIFGVSGDLAQRKLLPALTRLHELGKLGSDFNIIGVARRHLELSEVLESTGAQALSESMRFEQLDSTNVEDMRKLATILTEISDGEPMVRLFYASVPPNVAGNVISALGEAGLVDESNGPVRLMLEKPFGYDVSSAKDLNNQLLEVFNETQVYRIDHYLSKETTRNLSAFRFHNPIMERLWNGEQMSRVEIIAYEKLGIESRGDFYEQTGALRDIIQSHLINLAAVLMMEEPDHDDASSLHAARLELLSSIHIPAQHEVRAVARRGQYNGYRDDSGNNESVTETYAETTLQVEGERWRGTPLVLKTGKAMDAKCTEIRITFCGSTRHANDTNDLIFRLAPDEGIELTLETKAPGLTRETNKVALTYRYDEGRTDAQPAPDGYERVLIEAIDGDRRGFISGDEVLASWKIFQPVLDAWVANADDLIRYERGASTV